MSTRVLVLLALIVGVAQCFSWEFVVGQLKRLEFYNNGSVEHAEEIPVAAVITAVTYDILYDRVLFADYHNKTMSISSFDISTSKIQPLITKIKDPNKLTIKSLAYDPVTQLLFWMEGFDKIYSLSLKPASSNKTVDGKVFVTLDSFCGGIAVDSCGGFIYWITKNTIERAAFDGTRREILVGDHVFSRRSMAIDQKTQKMYWIEETSFKNYSIKSADLDGKDIRTIYFIGSEFWAHSLAVSKDFIYWWSYNQEAILQLSKRQQHGVGPKIYLNDQKIFWNLQAIAAKYTIKEQTLGIQGCEALKNAALEQATKVFTECYNYCVHGNCSIDVEGQPKCSCEPGFSGDRCEANACYKHCLNGGICSLSEDKPVCQCTTGYEGLRCDVATTHTDDCVCADKMTQQILRDLRSEVKQVIREELQCAPKAILDKFGENDVKIQNCTDSKKETTSNTQT